jgi:hypothetical protein
MKRRADGEVVDSPEPVEAYREGRRDEKARVEDETIAPRAERTDIKDAYERGRREERLRRRRSPILGLFVLVLVLIGAGMIYLAVENGSFSSGGAVVDQSLAKVSQTARAPIRGAADKTGDALQNAGQNLKQNAGSGHN